MNTKTINAQRGEQMEQIKESVLKIAMFIAAAVMSLFGLIFGSFCLVSSITQQSTSFLNYTTEVKIISILISCAAIVLPNSLSAYILDEFGLIKSFSSEKAAKILFIIGVALGLSALAIAVF